MQKKKRRFRKKLLTMFMIASMIAANVTTPLTAHAEDEVTETEVPKVEDSDEAEIPKVEDSDEAEIPKVEDSD